MKVKKNRRCLTSSRSTALATYQTIQTVAAVGNSASKPTRTRLENGMSRVPRTDAGDTSFEAEGDPMSLSKRCHDTGDTTSTVSWYGATRWRTTPDGTDGTDGQWMVNRSAQRWQQLGDFRKSVTPTPKTARRSISTAPSQDFCGNLMPQSCLLLRGYRTDVVILPKSNSDRACGAPYFRRAGVAPI
jgi:hypothetical protein